MLPAPAGPIIGAVDSSPDGSQFVAAIAFLDESERLCVSGAGDMADLDAAVAWARAHGAEKVMVGWSYVKNVRPARPGEIVPAGMRLTNERSKLLASLVAQGKVVTDGTLKVDHARADDKGSLSTKLSLSDVTGVKLMVWLSGEATRRDTPMRAAVW
jgi:hypothetical protein